MLELTGEYSRIQASVSAERPLEHLLNGAKISFREVADGVESIRQVAKQLVLQDWEMDDLNAIVKVAQRNQMACTLLANSLPKAGDFVGKWEFSIHARYPTLSLKRSL
jgi:hypothetical protein